MSEDVSVVVVGSCMTDLVRYCKSSKDFIVISENGLKSYHNHNHIKSYVLPCLKCGGKNDFVMHYSVLKNEK